MSLSILDTAFPNNFEVIFERRLASQVDLKDGLIADIIDAMQSRDWFIEDDRHWLLLCLDEAIVNAMLHGNEGDPQLEIEVFLGFNAEAKRWVIVVRDQGEGFCAADVPDSNNPESLLLEHGRGILLMREWLDELTYYNGGNTIYMARHCK